MTLNVKKANLTQVYPENAPLPRPYPKPLPRPKPTPLPRPRPIVTSAVQFLQQYQLTPGMWLTNVQWFNNQYSRSIFLQRNNNTLSNNTRDFFSLFQKLYITRTSNVTSVTEVRSASTRLFAIMWRPLGVLLQHCISIMLRLFFIVECDITRFLCAMHVFEVQASPHPLDYLCAKFRFFLASIVELAHGEKSHTQSILYSLGQLIWWPREPKRFRFVPNLKKTVKMCFFMKRIKSSQLCSGDLDLDPMTLTLDLYRGALYVRTKSSL